MIVSKIIITQDSEETQKIAKILQENDYEVEINPHYTVQEVCEQEKAFQDISEKFKNVTVKPIRIKESSDNLWYKKFNKRQY